MYCCKVVPAADSISLILCKRATAIDHTRAGKVLHMGKISTRLYVVLALLAHSCFAMHCVILT